MDLRKFIFIFIPLCSLFAMPVVHANSDTASERSSFSRERQERMEKKIQEIYNQLNLTDEQKKQLEDNKLKHQETRRASFEKMRSYKDALNQELMKADLDMNKINEIQSQLKALQSEMADARLNSILEVRKILTPEQFAKFISLMEKHKREESSAEEK